MAYEYTKQCIYPGCEKKRTGKGLCLNHYAMAKRLVDKGLTTWEDLEKLGKIDVKGANLTQEARWFLEKNGG